MVVWEVVFAAFVAVRQEVFEVFAAEVEFAAFAVREAEFEAWGVRLKHFPGGWALESEGVRVWQAVAWVQEMRDTLRKAV